MNTDSELASRLDALGHDWPAEASVESAVLARLDESGWAMGATRSRTLPRFLAGRSLAAAAFLAVVGIIAVMWGGGHSQTLYAQVQRTLARARSVHVVIQVVQNGELKHAGDMWYLRDVGFHSRLGPEVRIDDGRHAWRYVEGEPTAYRSNGTGENAEMWDDLLGLRSMLGREFVRVPDRDRKFGKVRTECYMASDEFEKRVAPTPDGRKIRPVVYVAPGFEVRRVEIEMLDGGEWKPTSVEDWEYDVEIDQSLFRPEFGAGVKIVDSDNVFEDFLSLDRAVYKETRYGLIYAVHRINRFEGGGLALLTSVRGTEETLAKFPLTKHRLGIGRMFVDPPATNWSASPQGDVYFRIPLASASNEGVDAQWWIVVPRDAPPTVFDVAPGKVKVTAGVTPNGSYAKVFEDAQGVGQQLSWDIELEVPTPTPLPELSKITDLAYRDLRMLDSVSMKYLDLGVEKDRFVGKIGSPDDITAEEFAVAVAEHIHFWQQRDIESQQKSRNASSLDADSSDEKQE